MFDGDDDDNDDVMMSVEGRTRVNANQVLRWNEVRKYGQLAADKSIYVTCIQQEGARRRHRLASRAGVKRCEELGDPASDMRGWRSRVNMPRPHQLIPSDRSRPSGSCNLT
jgi:hypothetical protein